MNSLDKDRLQRFLFHLGKGLWKAVPILGPIIDEVLYEQFEKELKGRLSKLSQKEINEILSNFPKIDIDRMDNLFESISDEQKLLNIYIILKIIMNLETKKERYFKHIESIKNDVEPIPSILDIVKKLQKNSGDKEALLELLTEIKTRRLDWIKRLSKNQKILLTIITKKPTKISVIWENTQNVIKNCGYKEFRFRLHELEWLGLVCRSWSQEEKTWEYELTKEGRDKKIDVMEKIFNGD